MKYIFQKHIYLSVMNDFEIKKVYIFRKTFDSQQL